jgi:tetratricopeptide (TPR) repeat protein
VLGLAEARTKDGDLDGALEALKEAAQLNPLDQEIREKLAAAAPIEEPDPEPAREVQARDVPVEELVPPAATITEKRDQPILSSPEIELQIQVREAVGTVAPEEPRYEAPPDESHITLEPAGVNDSTAVLAEITALKDPASEVLPLESFFEELRDKVARDQQVRAREQLDNGLRHLQENRQAEAIASFDEAVRNPALRFEAASQLARIFLGRGDQEISIDWMERALEAPAPTVEDRLALMYDLADTLASRGETTRAMAIFMEVESDTPGYRDVRQRIAQLSQAEIGKP